ncbi:MAG: CRISPR-associated endonuclease Cas2 [Paracoccaceae bacterium]|nr:CRISPR-associated endonuclease Cas2 [Paracoccaceae bacterium]
MDILSNYGIADTDGASAAQLRRVADICGKYGQRVQFSVFWCRLSATRMVLMKEEIEDAIDSDHDSVINYRSPRADPGFHNPALAELHTQARATLVALNSGVRTSADLRIAANL